MNIEHTSSESSTGRARVVELDVRDDLRHGREPFGRIMDAVAGLSGDDVLYLRATFEPVPLFKALGKRGFEHYALRQASDDWHVWFYRNARALEVRFDVRDMEPPEPMTRTLEALTTLPRDATLLHINARVPQFLLPILTERGFTYAIDTTDPDAIEVRIRHASDNA